MEDIIFINKRAKIYNLIKKISDFHGGDDISFLREYAKGCTDIYKNNLQVALECFLDLERQIDEKMNNMVFCYKNGYGI